MPETRSPAVPWVELAPGIDWLPVEHHALPFCARVRQVLFERAPQCVAVEFPECLHEALDQTTGGLPRLSALFWRPAKSSRVLFAGVDPCDARVEAFRLGLTYADEVVCVDDPEAAAGEEWRALPDDVAAAAVPASDLARSCAAALPDYANARARRIAARLAALRHRLGRVLFVGDARLAAGLRAALYQDDPSVPESPNPDFIRVEPVTAELLPFSLGELPDLTWRYEIFRHRSGDAETFRMRAALRNLLLDCADQYLEEFDEEIGLTDWRALEQYARNLSLLRGRLLPGLYELVTAAQGCVSDDFAALVLERATSWPLLKEQAVFDEHRSMNVYVQTEEGQTRAEPAWPRAPMQEVSFSLKRRRPGLEQQEEWREEFLSRGGWGICSWPPEDERIETFFDYLRKRALAQISQEHTFTEEFSSSMQDGLDFRETTRNWHTGRLYVKRERTPPGRVGPVVLIWRDMPLGAPGVWATTLYAEHQNESDICVYATQFGEEMAGPQISRSEYHGILSIYPAEGIPDLWRLPPLFRWETHARLLLAAAILLSKEKYVAWVADPPPDAELKQFARDHGVGIIHLPLTGFSKRTLRRLRQVHVLGSKAARGWAGDYIEGV